MEYIIRSFVKRSNLCENGIHYRSFVYVRMEYIKRSIVYVRMEYIIRSFVYVTTEYIIYGRIDLLFM